MLEIFERAVRKRITANTLPAARTATGWLVELEAGPRAVPGPAWGSIAVPEGGTSVPTDGPGAVPAALVGELRHQRDHFERQLADLHQHLEASEQAEAELRRLLAAALQKRALPAPREPESAPGADMPPRPWWTRWWPWGP